MDDNYYDVDYENFITQSSIATAVLSGLVFLFILIRMSRVCLFGPYLLAALTALCYLIPSAILGSSHAMSYDQAYSASLAVYFFIGISTALIWTIVFKVIGLALPSNTAPDVPRKSCYLNGCYFAYLWTFILLICDIAFVGTLDTYFNGSGEVTKRSILSSAKAYQVCIFGSWGYVFWLLWQLLLSWTYIAAFIRSLMVYIFLAILVTIGRTVLFATPVDYYSSPMVPAIVDFVLSQLVGLIALVYVSCFAPKWRASTDGQAVFPSCNIDGEPKNQDRNIDQPSTDKTEVAPNVA
ncbi:hypothetical protein BX666DRAFT_1900509 [Dichotomocladium elegans]|nr:hypothetical protein BX666DRAFT_1900509 [Dichotomocladium elegans]